MWKLVLWNKHKKLHIGMNLLISANTWQMQKDQSNSEITQFVSLFVQYILALIFNSAEK